MSHNSKSPFTFVKSVFGPKVAVLSSHDAELVSKRNNLSFVELLRPFCNITKEIQVRDVNSQLVQVTDFCLSLQNLKSELPNEAQTTQLISNSVQSCIEDRSSLQTWNIVHENYDININMACPWFEAYRENVIALAPQKENEFINNFVACLLVVSSSHPNPLEEFSRLSGEQNKIQHSNPDSCWRWMIPNTLKYFVLLHDNSQADLSRAQAVMKELQSMHNNACFLLQINSKNSTEEDDQSMPDPWTKYLTCKIASGKESTKSDQDKDAKEKKVYGGCLTISDHENLRTFLYECANKGIIPHMEKNIRVFNEQIGQRKAPLRTIVRATKGFFGRSTTSPSSATSSVGGRATDPLEQIRKVADLCFLCQLYENAYHFYSLAKKDLAHEQAWLSAAGASEMAALSIFMQQTRAHRAYPSQYVESAMDTYINRTSDDYILLRCVLISLECLCHQGLYHDAASQLLRLTNDDNDLKCALLLEQVAYCYLRKSRRCLRKFAFYLVLAGHRFGKASQRQCALHCYSSALQVYANSGWRLALDHIYFTLGRHCIGVSDFGEAVSSFQQLVIKSAQSPMQQLMFLNEYLEISRRHKDKSSQEIVYRVPAIDGKRNSLRFEASPPGHQYNQAFEQLEDIAHEKLYTAGPFIKKKIEAVENEPVWLDVCIVNNLEVDLAMGDISLQYEYQTTEGESMTMTMSPIPGVNVQATSTQFLTFHFQPHTPGVIKISGMRYKLATISNGSQVQPAKLEGVQKFEEEMMLNVVSAMPKISVEMKQPLPVDMKLDEIASSTILIRNTGPKTARKISAVSSSRSVCFITDTHVSVKQISEEFLRVHSGDKQPAGRSIIQKCLLDELSADGQSEMKLWYQASTAKSHEVELVLYYENDPATDSHSKTRTRTFRFRHESLVQPGLKLTNQVSWKCGGKSSALVVVRPLFPQPPHARMVSFCCDTDLWFVAHLPTPPCNPQNFAFRLERLATVTTNNDRNIMKTQWIDLERGNTEAVRDGERAELRLVDELNAIHVRNDEAETKPLTLAVQWSEEGRYGQSYLSIDELGAMANLKEALSHDAKSKHLETLHRIVKWSIHSKSEHHHDFNEACIIPIEVVFSNQHNFPIRVTVDAARPLGAAPNKSAVGDTPHHNSQTFTWVGKVLFDMRLEACAQRSLTLHAYFTQSGTFNVNSFEVSASPITTSSSQMLPQTRQPSVLISVFNDNEIF